MTEILYTSFPDCEIEVINLHDNFFKDYFDLPNNMRNMFIDKLVNILTGELSLNSATISYHPETTERLKKPSTQRLLKVRFSDEEKIIDWHHSMKNGYSFYMEIKNRHLYIGRLCKHI